MTTDRTDALVSTAWLADHLDAPDIRIVDATYYLPTENKNARQLFEEAHIPGAVFFDIDEISNTGRDLPHMVPPPEKFSAKARKLGLGDGSRIVVYDQKGIVSAPRVWWMFRLFGHQDVAVLDGGLPKWRREERPVEDGPARGPGERHFTARTNNALLRERDQVWRAITTGRAQVVDARTAERFRGEAAEPRAGLRNGHIPASVNVPFDSLIDPQDGTLKDEAAISEAFRQAAVDPKRPVITTCGSGVTACVLALALRTIGAKDVAVYDGSWAEWGASAETPVETGPANVETTS
mgnify:CR=1 FL=1